MSQLSVPFSSLVLISSTSPSPSPNFVSNLENPSLQNEESSFVERDQNVQLVPISSQIIQEPTDQRSI